MTLKINGGRSQLPTDFVPGNYTVLCGRGRGSKCTKSTGNQRLKSHVLGYLKTYSEARKKSERSTIISKILASVKEDAPDGSFVKLEDDGSWWELDDTFAREKISCLFRECLHTHYRSSTKAKYARGKKAAKGRRTMVYGNDSCAADRIYYASPPMLREIFSRQWYDQAVHRPYVPRATGFQSAKTSDSCSKSFSANSVDSKRINHLRQQSFVVEDYDGAPHPSNTNCHKSKSLLEEACKLLLGALAEDDPTMREFPDDMSDMFEATFNF
jgi:hypothetical protein